VQTSSLPNADLTVEGHVRCGFGAGEHRSWDEAKRLGGLEIDDEVKLGWLLDRNIQQPPCRLRM
jgi:hypothetical protein